jgi:hypothetical protein
LLLVQQTRNSKKLLGELQQTGLGGLWPVPQGAEVAKFVSNFQARTYAVLFVTYLYSQQKMYGRKIEIAPHSNNYAGIVGLVVSFQNPPQELQQPHWPTQTELR